MPVKSPPVYRPTATARPALQPKCSGSLKLENRPAPPVYQPSRVPATIAQRRVLARVPVLSFPSGIPQAPVARAFPPLLRASVPLVRTSIQRMEAPPKPIPKTGSSEIALSAFKVIKDYRPNLLNEIEKAFLSAGYNSNTVRAAILRGLKAWGKDISGHSSKIGSTDKGEQGDLNDDCIEARDFLLAWVTVNPATQTTKQPVMKHSKAEQELYAEKKTKAKSDAKTNKHLDWHKEKNTPQGPPCPVCKELGIV